jgi:hypothetical protein
MPTAVGQASRLSQNPVQITGGTPVLHLQNPSHSTKTTYDPRTIAKRPHRRQSPQSSERSYFQKQIETNPFQKISWILKREQTQVRHRPRPAKKQKKLLDPAATDAFHPLRIATRVFPPPCNHHPTRRFRRDRPTSPPANSTPRVATASEPSARRQSHPSRPSAFGKIALPNSM